MFWKKKKPEEEELDRLISSMDSKNVSESLSAVSSIVKMGTGSPELVREYLVPMMPKLLEDGKVHVRTRAAFTLSGLIFAAPELRGDLIKYAIELLRHKDRTMRLYAAGLLGRVAVEAPEHLKAFMGEIKELLRGRDELRAFDASFALGEIGFGAPFLVEDVIPTMTELLEKRAELIVNSFNSITLKSPMLIKGSVPRLVEVVKRTKDLNISWGISTLLARLSHTSAEVAEELVLPYVETLLEGKTGFARASAVYMIGEIGIRYPDLIRKHLPRMSGLSTDHESIVRTFSALSMGRVCYRSPELAATLVPELLKLFNDMNDTVRGAAAISLRYVAASSPGRVEPIIQKLSKMLEDRDQVLRGFASIGLRLVSQVAPDIVSDIAERVSERVAEGNVHVRRGAAFILHVISTIPDPDIDRGILPEVVRLLDDQDSNVKVRAVLALKSLVPAFPDLAKAQAPRILELLDDKDGLIRMQASSFFGEIAYYHPEAVKDLVLSKMVILLEDREQQVRNAAALSLGKIL